MKSIRLLTIILVLAFSAVFLAACGKSDDSSKKAPKTSEVKIPTTKPTDTPTPTEAPKTPEQKDQDAVLNILGAAEKIAAKKKYTFDDPTSVLIKFDDGKIMLDTDPLKTYQIRFREDWIDATSFRKIEYEMQSELYRKTCRYATIKGVIESDGTVSWTADNIDTELFSVLKEHKVEWDPAYLKRVELYEEIKGVWSGELQLSIEALARLMVDELGSESLDYYHNLMTFLKKYGFSGNQKIVINCTIVNEKEEELTSYNDWTEFLLALDKATATKDGMTTFLCVCSDVDQRTLNAVLKQRGTDVMTFGGMVVTTIKNMCAKDSVIKTRNQYILSDTDNVLLIPGPHSSDKLTYDKDKGTLTYRNFLMECVMKRQQ